MNPDVGYPPARRGPDRAVKIDHRLTPADVERIVDALEVDGLAVWSDEPSIAPASNARITAALCGGTESDYA